MKNKQYATNEIRAKSKNTRIQMKAKYNNLKPMECSKSSSKREVYINNIKPQEPKKSQMNNLTLHLK